MSDRPDASVEVVAYSDDWPASFEAEQAALGVALGELAVSIEHIGSTAVPGLAAKPTIDIMVVVDSVDAFLQRLPAVEALGYEYRPNNTLVGPFEFPMQSADAVAFLDNAWREWRAGLDAIGEVGLWRPFGDAEGDISNMQLGVDDPFIGLVLHVHREVIHHGAEILLLRDLYRNTRS